MPKWKKNVSLNVSQFKQFDPFGARVKNGSNHLILTSLNRSGMIHPARLFCEHELWTISNNNQHVVTKLWQGVVLKRLTRPKYSLSDSFETSDSKPGFSNCNFEIFEFEKKNPKLTVCALLKPITKSHWRAERELIIMPDQTPTNNQFMSKASVTNFARISEEYRENQLRNIQFSCRQSSEYLKVSVF